LYTQYRESDIADQPWLRRQDAVDGLRSLWSIVFLNPAARANAGCGRPMDRRRPAVEAAGPESWWLAQFRRGEAAHNVQLRLRNLGATALDEDSEHDHEEHTGHNLDHGDAVHGNSFLCSLGRWMLSRLDG